MRTKYLHTLNRIIFLKITKTTFQLGFSWHHKAELIIRARSQYQTSLQMYLRQHVKIWILEINSLVFFHVFEHQIIEFLVESDVANVDWDCIIAVALLCGLFSNFWILLHVKRYFFLVYLKAKSEQILLHFNATFGYILDVLNVALILFGIWCSRNLRFCNFWTFLDFFEIH